MARRLVWMPVLPRVTVSAALNLRESAGRTKGRVAKAAGWIQTAPAAQAVRWRNSRRFMGPPRGGLFRAVRRLHMAKLQRDLHDQTTCNTALQSRHGFPSGPGQGTRLRLGRGH